MGQVRLRVVRKYPTELLRNRWPNREDIQRERDVVSNIIECVKGSGDEALVNFTRLYDRVSLTKECIKVDHEEIDDAYAQVTRSQVDALTEAIERLQIVSRSLLERLEVEVAFKGVRTRIRTSPLSDVGIYVPGGRASYPSSVLMCAVPARIAGVERIVVTTPPGRDAKVNSLTLVACDLCGIDEVFKIGGAQAIAALAYGTETIRPVMKIVGPGNKYVTAAKRIVSKDIPIDMPAGPSELIVIADSTADARHVALDILSQAEHDEDAKVIVVTNSEQLAQSVQIEISQALANAKSQDVIAKSLTKNGLIYVYDSLEEGIRFVNEYAPEHLQIVSDCATRIRKRISSAGLVLIGQNSPVAASDYMLGTNHVLPTSGFAKAYSGLSVFDFVKIITEVSVTKEGLSLVEPYATMLAEKEGLGMHAKAIRGRFC